MKTRFVAEVSSNWCRRSARGDRAADLERALAFVDTAAGLGCAAVKFQQFRIRELFHPVALRALHFLRRREDWELPEEFNAELAARARERKIAFASTPFYRSAVDVLAPHVDFFKLASYQLLWLEMLAAVARTGKPVVLATGMATLEEVQGAVATLRENGCRELTLLHCVSAYPTPVADANLRAIQTLRTTFRGVPVGWSDHTQRAEVIERAVRGHGAEMVEFHLDLDRDGAEYSGRHCWLPGEINWVMKTLTRAGPAELRRSHLADGDGAKTPRPSELHECDWRTDPVDGLRPMRKIRALLERELAA